MVDRGSLFIIYGFTVFSMQAGFSMLEAGAVRAKNMKHILLKNILDTCFGFMCWYVAGWAISSGQEGNSIFGTSEFFLMDTTRYDLCFFSYGFAATSATIISGAVAERIRLESYLAFVCIMIVFIYSPVSYWVWSKKGWLRYGNHFGMIDWAGSGVVHMVGGISGLVGIKFIGPRMGRFTETLLHNEMVEIPSRARGRARIVTFDIPDDDNDSDTSWQFGHEDYIIPMNVVGLTGNTESLQVLGTFLIWIGWFPFNVGMVASHGYGTDIPLNTSLEGMIAVNTLISSCASCITVAAIIHYKEGVWLTSKVCNSILSGAVAITAGCASMQPSFAFLCGSINGILYYFSSNLLITRKIDDPLEASCVHGLSGLWGLVAAALFSDNALLRQAYKEFIPSDYEIPSFGMRIATQSFGILMIIVYVLTLSCVAYMVVHQIFGLRIRKTLEQRGLNQQFHDDGYIAFCKDKKGYKIDFHKPSSAHYPVGWTKAVMREEGRDIPIE